MCGAMVPEKYGPSQREFMVGIKAGIPATGHASSWRFRSMILQRKDLAGIKKGNEEDAGSSINVALDHFSPR
jgi:hypothetical protein